MLKQLTFVLLTFLLTACAQSNAIELQGRIAMKGTSINSYLVIEDSKSKKSYKIKNETFQNLLKKQKHTVKIKANLLKEAIGPGFPAEIEVLEVEDLTQ